MIARPLLFEVCPLHVRRSGTGAAGVSSKPGNGVGLTASGKSKAGFHPKHGPINALWLGDSGSVAVVPNSGTLSAGIETMKKPAKQLRLCLAAGVACMGAGDCDRARHATAEALEAPLLDRGAGLRFSPEQRVRF